MFLRLKSDKPGSGELSAAVEAASAESAPDNPAPAMIALADSSAKPANNGASQAPQKLSDEMRQKLAEGET